MKKSKWLIWLLMPLLVCGLAISAQAATGAQQIEATYRDISILVHGNPITPDVEPFITNNRTMVPIRFIAQALGENVTWDQEKAQVRVASPLVLHEDFNGKTIYLNKESQVFSVMLEGNPTTGFTWSVDKGLDQTLLKSIGEPTYMTDAKPEVVGAGGVFLFSFITQGAVGETTLKLNYARSWEDVAPEQTFTLKVRINLLDSVITLSEEDNGAAVYVVMPSQQITLLLPANPSTGYSWEIVGADGQILKLDGEPTFKPDTELLGSPGIFTYKFVPVSPGETTVKLNYSKAGADKPEKEFTLQVGVF